MRWIALTIFSMQRTRYPPFFKDLASKSQQKLAIREMKRSPVPEQMKAKLIEVGHGPVGEDSITMLSRIQ